MTKPENAESTTAPARPADPGTAAEDPVMRQRTTSGDREPKTVTLQVGAPEHARPSVRRPERGDQDGRAGATGLAATTVRVGGHIPPERITPAPPASSAASSGSARVRPARVPRRTSLQLQRLEPWSVLKLSLVLSIAGFFAWMVAVGVLYGVLAGMGVWDQVNGTYSDFNPTGSTEVISGGRVFGVALVVGLVNIVLMTALTTVGSLIYNIAADLVGGVEVTLSEPD